MASSGAWQALAEGLMRDHYDPRYLKHRLRYAEREKAVVALNDLQDLDAATGQVEAALADLAR